MDEHKVIARDNIRDILAELVDEAKFLLEAEVDAAKEAKESTVKILICKAYCEGYLKAMEKAEQVINKTLE